MSADAEPGPLWRAICDPDIYGQPVGTPIWPTQLAERILADPAPLLAALAEAGVLTRTTGEHHMTGRDLVYYSTRWRETKP